MSIRRWSLALLALSLNLCAHAQGTVPARSDAKADPKAEEAAAAMERAKRLAAGPMRVILEASKGKRVAAEAPPAEAAGLRPAAAPVAAAVVASDPAAVTTQITLSAGTLQGPSTTSPVPGIERTSFAAPAAMPSLPAALALLTKPTDALAKPKIISRVDPDLPPRLLDDLGRNAVVAVDLNIRADGSVGGVGLVTNVPPRVQRLVVGALEQWRFEPLPADRVHRIQLVFNGE